MAPMVICLTSWLEELTMSIFFYAVLGFVLSLCGVGILENPLGFIAVMACVIGIDLVGRTC